MRNISILIVIGLYSIVINQGFLVDWFLEFFRHKIEKAIEEKLKDIKNKEGDDKVEKIKEKFGSEQYITYRTEKLGFITTIIGILEIIFFTAIIYFKSDIFLPTFGGWLGIKTAVNYDQWSHPIAGKAYFYTSILGTLINIGIPVIVIFLLKV